MRDLFATLYSWFVPMYGNDVDLFLKGMDDEGGFTNNSNYVTVGWALGIGTLFMVVLFYYIINSVRFGRWYHWLAVLVVNFILQLLLGYYLPFLDYNKGNMASQLQGSFQEEHLWYFGWANALLSIVFLSVFHFFYGGGAETARRRPFQDSNNYFVIINYTLNLSIKSC